MATPKPVILIAPLDWGLGHTTRCIPLIQHLLMLDCEIVVACNTVQRAVLNQEFTSVKFVHLQGYGLYFARNRFVTLLALFFQIPKILAKIRHEKKWLNIFLGNNHINAVISDNRYGVFSRKVPSVFITHQLAIRTPFGNLGERVLRRLNYRLIEKFSECWVPDFEGAENLGGRLSHPITLPSVPVKYMGMLSRLYLSPSKEDTTLLILLSGPEPQRSIFERKLLNQLKAFSDPAILVRGLPLNARPLASINPNLHIYNHLSADKLNQVVNDSTYVVSRSGYSTIMDMLGLQKKCIFVPTPGQLEQEYLARYLSEKSFCVSYSQVEFCLETALIEAEKLVPPAFEAREKDLFKETIDQFIAKLSV